MAVVAVMKKDENRKFDVLTYDKESKIIVMQEEGQEPKEIKRKTFTKGYKLLEGSLDDLSAPQPQEEPEEPTGQSGDELILSVGIEKMEGRMQRTVDVELSVADITDIEEEQFIIDLVNTHGAIHGDKVMVNGRSMGLIDLNHPKPCFKMLAPEVLKEDQAESVTADTVTIVYQGSGNRVTMSRREYYELHSVGARSAKEPELKSDPLPEAMQDYPASPPPPPPAPPSKPQWTLVGANSAIGESRLDASKTQVVDMDATGGNSMRASRDSKAEAEPFIPEPFFLRQSMISSYLQCPDKMYDTYENDYNEESIFTKTGTAIHGIMEDYYKDPENANVPELFEKWWADHSTPEWDWYRDWKVMVNDYFERQAKYDKPNIIALELEWQAKINGVPCSGTIDRIDRVDENTIRIVDYKTNFRAWSDNELAESVQFQFYDCAVRTDEVRELLKQAGDTGEFDRVICTYDMLRLGYRQHVEFEADTLAEFRNWVAMIWTKILDGRDRRPKLNTYCGFCQKRHKCQLYMEQLESPVPSIPIENKGIEYWTSQRDTLKDKEKLLKNRLAEVDGAIKQAIADGKGEIEIGEHIWSMSSSTRKSYPTSDVFRIMAMNGMGDKIGDIVSIQSGNLKRVLKENEGILEAIESKAQVAYTAPTLNRRKKPKPKKDDKK